MLRSFLLRLAVLMAGAGLLGACGERLPPLEPRPASQALPAAEAGATALGRGIAPRVDAHAGASGVLALTDAREAFAARVLLAQAAERTLDVQYYIWRDDFTGTMLLDALHAAADRGVRVRLLLDDNGVAGLDETLAALDTHANAEVRLFNPFAVRRPKWLGYVGDFGRLNRRMHNKSFTADNQATIIGGRNVGDEYFAATDGVLFADLDLLAVGPVVGDVSADFDRYWSSASAYPASSLLPPAGPDSLERLRRDAVQAAGDPRARAYVQAVHDTPFATALLEGDLPLIWAPVRMVSDDPAKALGRVDDDGLLVHQLADVLGEPAAEVDLISPYFVPTEAGVAFFGGLAREGLRVRVLTNALEATDVAPVHAGYARRRKALLEQGVVLFEMRRDVGSADPGSGVFGSSGSSLHAKTFAVDGERVFVGSFNFDPRSAHLNTELGFVVDSPQLAVRMREAFAEAVPRYAYEVRLDPATGGLYWLERRGGELVRHDTEPGTGWFQRAGVRAMSWLPIEWLL